MALTATSLSRSALLDEFVGDLASKGLTVRNQQAHRSAVERLAEFLAPAPALSANPADLRRFLAYLGELGVSGQSQGVYRTVLTTWLEFSARHAPAPTPVAVSTPVTRQVAEVLLDGGDSDEQTQLTAFVPEPSPSIDRVDGDATWPLWRQGDGAQIPESPARLAGVLVVTPVVQAIAISVDNVEQTGTPHVAARSAGFSLAAAQPALPDGSGDGERVADAAYQAIENVATEEAKLAGEEARLVGQWQGSARASVPELAFSDGPVSEGQGTSAANIGTAWQLTDTSVASTAGFSFGDDAAGSQPPPSDAPASAAVTTPDQASPASSGFSFDAPPPEMMSFAQVAAPAMPSARASTQSTMAAEMAEGPMIAPSAYMDGAIALSRDDDAHGAKAASAGDSTAARKTSAAPVAKLDESSTNWGLRSRGNERTDLSLASIRDMARSGVLTSQAMVRRPGGDWMRAGSYGPLQSLIVARAESEAQGSVDDAENAARAPVSFPTARAWAGAAAGGMAGALAWWLAAIVAGHEIAWVGASAGILAGVLARVGCRGEAMRPGIAAAFCGLAGVVVGRYLVWATMAAGVMGPSANLPSATSFLLGGLRPVEHAVLVVAALLGYLIAGRGRSSALPQAPAAAAGSRSR